MTFLKAETRLERPAHCARDQRVPRHICLFAVKPLKLQAVSCLLTNRAQVLLLPGFDRCHIRHRMSFSLSSSFQHRSLCELQLLIYFQTFQDTAKSFSLLFLCLLQDYCYASKGFGLLEMNGSKGTLRGAGKRCYSLPLACLCRLHASNHRNLWWLRFLKGVHGIARGWIVGCDALHFW